MVVVSGCIVGVHMHGCVFENNSALIKGGVFEILEGALFIEQCSFHTIRQGKEVQY